jgi:hypothetical protein
MLPPQFGRRKYRGYYHDRFEPDEGDGLLLTGILLAMWGIYWLVVHWIDWAIGNHMAWWAEPLTLFVTLPVMGFFAMIIDKYESWNPLHWWPMFWGTKIMIDRETDFYMAFDPGEFVQNNGGRYNVFCSTDNNEDLYVKFRRRRDAVVYSLRNI